MNLKRHSIYFWLSRISVLLIYIPFFAVQCFFNYSSITQAKIENFATHYEHTATNTKASIVDSQKKQSENKTFVSLNKRFERANILSCFIFSFELATCFHETKSFGSYINFVIPSFLFDTGTLRGPPVIA